MRENFEKWLVVGVLALAIGAALGLVSAVGAFDEPDPRLERTSELPPSWRWERPERSFDRLFGPPRGDR